MLARLVALLEGEEGQLRRPLGAVLVAAAIATTSVAILIPRGGVVTANVWLATTGNDGTCTRSASPIEYSAALPCVTYEQAGLVASPGDEVGVNLDRRRFRANIVLETRDREVFLEDRWVGGTLVFGNSEPRPAVTVTARDLRCVMVNLDPDTATKDARVMRTVG